MIVAGTGHRPNKFPNRSYSWDEDYSRLHKVATNWLRNTTNKGHLVTVVTGMALGWDQILAKAAIDLNIPIKAYLPFDGQEKVWPSKSDGRRLWNRIMEVADEVVTVSLGGYTPQKMQLRNIRMVDAANVLLAAWNGSSGGTANCINYARQREGQGLLEIHNVWPWESESFLCEE